MKNKGFSLVELIIVIAIMAILAAAIAPALIRYIDKSRRGDDVQAAATINTAVQSVLANEDAYDAAADAMRDNGDELATCDAKTKGSTFVAGTGLDTALNSGKNATIFIDDLNSNLGNEAPTIKYTKDFDDGASATNWVVYANTAGKPVIFLCTANNDYELQPDIDASYK